MRGIPGHAGRSARPTATSSSRPCPRSSPAARPATSATTRRRRAVEHHEPFALGRAEVLSEGDDVALLTYGFLLREAATAAARSSRRAGISVRLVNLRTLTPVDEAAIVDAARRTPTRRHRRGPLPDRRPLLDRGRGPGAARAWPRRVLPIALDDALVHARAPRATCSRTRASPAPQIAGRACSTPCSSGGHDGHAERRRFNEARPVIAESDAPATRARRASSPPRTQTLAKGPGPVRARRRAEVPAARAGRARLGRRRQRVPRLQHGGRTDLARLRLPGGRRGHPRRSSRTASRSRSCIRSRSRSPSWCARSCPAPRRVRFGKTGAT